jgi:hypothetical protein
MNAYIGSGVICQRNAATNADGIWIPPTNLANHTLSNFATRPHAGDTVFLFNDNLKEGAQDDQWEKRVIVSTDQDPAACVGPPYTDLVQDAGKSRIFIKLNAAIPDSVKVGAVVRFTRPVEYSIYTESSGKSYLGIREYGSGAVGILRAAGRTVCCLRAGDANPSGLQFRYYDSTGVRITNMANKKDVARVDVFMRTNQGKVSHHRTQGEFRPGFHPDAGSYPQFQVRS